MAKKIQYRIITGDKGFKDLEDKVTIRINKGWKLIGGLAFNGGYPYQAMAKVVEEGEDEVEVQTGKKEKLGMATAAEAMKRLDDLL